MRIHVHTLGCKVNQFESQAMESILAEKGAEISTVPEDCDGIIINTCAVTAESGRKSRQAVRRFRALCPGAKIAVCGCYSQLDPEAVRALGADLVGGSDGRAAFAEEFLKVLRGQDGFIALDEPLRRRRFESLPAGGLYGRTRAMLKIQDGCSNFCTYCVIPYTRGPVRSQPLEEAAEEAARLKARGYRELVITGIEIASYGRDLKGDIGLHDAVEAIGAAAPGVRLRLGSLEPRVITEEFCRRVAGVEGLCPHFHLSLQSGCDATLSRMRRKYDTARFYQSVELLRKYFPGCALTADLITGFPGEDEAEFGETMAFIEKCDFSAMHIFPYSPRPGTAAAGMENQVENRIKAERAHRASALADAMERRYLESCVGKSLNVLFETEGEEGSVGHAENYVPVIVSERALRGRVREVAICAVEKGRLSGELVC
ncbi:MAG: tRNA (N(6)-L-threonylcarbamoyladenosine(37)-C(2))-methylthiotransferase MtaB [Oscillospiraceae bacterium]|nr:tRNA (N(6)-L-threonylcarbamoyladenosine(37)-C(2))-methylthiotransferase MtaB [Oscillospiraceae bacterium]